MLKRKKSRKPLLPNYKSAIIDEAHKLVQAATDMYSFAIKQSEIETLIRQIKPQTDNNQLNRMMQLSCNEVLQINEMIFEESKKVIRYELFDTTIENYSIQLTKDIKNLFNRLYLNLRYLVELLPDNKWQYISNIKRITESIKVILTNDTICWLAITSNKENGELHFLEKNIEDQISSDAFGMDLLYILTSGTIAVDGVFDYFSNSICLDKLKSKRIQYLSMKSPFDYEKNTLMYQAIGIPFPNSEDDVYIEAISIEIEQLIQASHGHALVLFASYVVLQKVFRRLTDSNLEFPLFKVLKGNQSIIKEYRESKNGVLVACGPAWEGIDFKGDLLSHLIIVKLPFLIPDPITDYHKSLYENYGDFQKEVLIPRMLTRLKQGHGRAIRSERDTAVISILEGSSKGIAKM